MFQSVLFTIIYTYFLVLDIFWKEEKEMAYVTMSVRGVKRNVSVEKQLSANSFRGKLRVDGKTVRGVVKTNMSGVKTFTPTGSNAGLI